MLRLTLLLCAGMFAALMIAGEDRGQMRPGLALAVSEGRLPRVREPASMIAAPETPAVVADEVAQPVVEPAAETVAIARASDPIVVPVPEPVVVEPARTVVQVVKEPIFTLSALGNEPVPGQTGSITETSAPEGAEADGTIWYVNASSVNVRAEPSTAAEVLGRLTNGEAALLVATVNGDWARIVIQGDGMEGFVAMRYLSPVAP